MADIKDQETVIAALNQLLSDFKILYQNVRGYHWNVKGSDFFILHEKFEELYTNIAESADEVAERILYLEGTPYHTYQDYIDQSKVEVIRDESDEKKIVQHLLDNLEQVADTARSLIEVAGDNNDYVSEDMGIEYETRIDESRWMFRSYMNR